LSSKGRRVFPPLGGCPEQRKAAGFQRLRAMPV